MTNEQIAAVAYSAVYHHLRFQDLTADMCAALTRQEITYASPEDLDAVERLIDDIRLQLVQRTEKHFIDAVSALCLSKLKT